MVTAVIKETNQYTYLIEKINQSGYKLRQAVVDSIFYHEGKHLSCEDIFQHVRCKYPRMSLATVYRTIHLLEGIGLLNRIDFDGCTRYELNNLEENSHCHLICLNCRNVSKGKGRFDVFVGKLAL